VLQKYMKQACGADLHGAVCDSPTWLSSRGR